MGTAIKYRELKRRYELDGAERTCEHFAEALREKHLRPEDFSLRELAEALVPDGREWVHSLGPQKSGYVIESGDAVDVTAFSNITGQIVYTKLLESYQAEEFVCTRLVDTRPTPFDGEKIPGIAGIPQENAEVHPGMPYPSLGFGEDWIETPHTTKHGRIIPVTKEAIFFDRTGLVLSFASKIGEWLGINKENRIADVMAGVVNNYKWKGTPYNTYQTASPWINDKAGNDLEDWKNVDVVEQMFANMLDPHTQQPIVLGGMSVLVTPARRHAAARIFNATMVEYVDNTAGAGTVRTTHANPVTGYTFESSRYFYRRLIDSGLTADQAKVNWLAGNFKKAFAYMENWPITVVQAQNNSEAEFTQDIVLRFKASERGVAAVLDPRYVVRCKHSG